MAQIRLLENDVEKKKIALGRAPFTVGREKDNTLALPGSKVSRNHLRIFPEPGGWRLVDLGSANGTRVNGKRVEDTILHHGDRVEIGDFVLLFQDPEGQHAKARPQTGPQAPAKTPAPARAPAGAPAPGGGSSLVARGGGFDDRRIPLSGPLRIGRGEGNDVRIDVKEVSGKHARLVPARGGYRIEDLGSTNGTRVNGNRLKAQTLAHGDEIEIGPVRFLFLAPGAAEDRVVADFRRRRMAHERRFALVAEDGRNEWELASLPFSVGRLPENDLALDDPNLSGRHARFFMEDHHLHVEDLNSTNGTLVDGKRVGKARVGHGSELEFGRLYFLVRDVDYAFPAPPPRSSRLPLAAALLVVLALGVAIVAPFFLGETAEAPADEPNLLERNASFDDSAGAGGSLPGWRLAGEAFALDHEETAHGSTSLRIELPAAAGAPLLAEAVHTEALSVRPETTYRVGCRIRASCSPGVAGIRLDWSGDPSALPFACSYSDLVTGDTGWLALETLLTAPPGARSARLVLVAQGNGGTVWFDDVRVSPGRAAGTRSVLPLATPRLRGWINRRGLVSVDPGTGIVVREVGLVFWNRDRVTLGSQDLCLPAAGYPRSVEGDFRLRAEAVKLSEGLVVPFEVRARTEGETIQLSYRAHADAGHLAAGDRIAVALGLSAGVQQLILASGEREEKVARSSFGSVTGVSSVRIMTEGGELTATFEPALTVNGLADDTGRMTLFASAGLDRDDLGKIVETTVTLGLPPDRAQARAALLLKEADAHLAARRLGRAHALYRRVEREFPDAAQAVSEAQYRTAGIETELDRSVTVLRKALEDFKAAPTASSFSAFLFRVEEAEGLFGGMEGSEECASLRDRASEIYQGVAGPGFAQARQALAEAKAAYETNDWVRAESLCSRILAELEEEALAPGARAILSEINRRRADAEEVEAWVDGRIRVAKDLESRDDAQTAKEVYGEILKRYPRGEWAKFAQEQIQRLEK